MQIEPKILNRIIKNAFLSLFIYALPIVLMFLAFYITGDRPWEKETREKKQEKVHQTASAIKVKSTR